MRVYSDAARAAIRRVRSLTPGIADIRDALQENPDDALGAVRDALNGVLDALGYSASWDTREHIDALSAGDALNGLHATLIKAEYARLDVVDALGEVIMTLEGHRAPLHDEPGVETGRGSTGA